MADRYSRHSVFLSLYSLSRFVADNWNRPGVHRFFFSIKGHIASVLGFVGQEARLRILCTYLRYREKTNFHQFLIDEIQDIIIIG